MALRAMDWSSSKTFKIFMEDNWTIETEAVAE